MENIEIESEFKRLASSLQLYAIYLTKDQESAKDLLQETYLRAIENLDKFIKKTNFKAWLFTIMRNTFINEYRRFMKMNMTPLENQSDVLFSEELSDELYDINLIELLIKHLSKQEHLTFEMFLQGYKYEEIAETLNISIGTVRSRIHTIRGKLRKTLE